MPRKVQTDFFYNERRLKDGRRTYTVQVRLNGDREGRTFYDLAEAKAWWKERRTKARERSPGSAPPKRGTLANIIAAYLKEPTVRAQRALKDTEAALAWWENKFGTVRVAALNLDTLKKARDLMLEKDLSNGTVTRRMAVMQACYANQVPERPWPKPRGFMPRTEGKQRYLTKRELAKLLDAARSDQLIAEGIEIAVGTGLRLSEMLELKWSDVDLDNAHLTVIRSKNGDTRRAHLIPIVVDAFRRLNLNCQKFVFPSKSATARIDKFAFTRRYRAVRKAANLEDVRWHDLRHSCASFLASVGATQIEIAEVLGHRSVASSWRYTHLPKGVALRPHSALNELLK